jgi:hypothetical protein
VDHWLHALAKLGVLRQRDLMKHRAPVNLRGDDHDSDQMVAMKLKKGAQKTDGQKTDGQKTDGQSLDDLNRGAVVSHPFRSPLFKF